MVKDEIIDLNKDWVFDNDWVNRKEEVGSLIKVPILEDSCDIVRDWDVDLNKEERPKRDWLIVK